ncbi:MAG: branched-chain amino acid ABC transporter permease [Actinobacteria bacterium]|jgi:ABC-type branched-subunit amino acid transport system permease subunit|nr:branched-chain amino acid ABC transporter permease [Actinomycetota bacterium]
MTSLLRFPGGRLVSHALFVIIIWLFVMRINDSVDPLANYYIALVAMYATAMFGMVILVGLSGQVSLGNGALMAVGGYVFAVTSLNWQTVPFLGLPWNGLWSMGFAAVGGIVVGLLVGGIAARLRGPYLAGLTLGLAVGVPAIANRFPELLGGESGLMITVPYPDGGYAPIEEAAFADSSVEAVAAESATTAAPSAAASVSPDDMLTMDNFPTTDVAPSAAASVSPDDMLTMDNFPTTDVSAAPSIDPSVVDPGAIDPSATDLSGAGDLLASAFIIERWQAGLAITVACIAAFIALNLVRGRQGRVWRAVRDDSVAAAVAGISPAKAKVSAFAVSSLFAALAGAVFAQILSYVGPGAFGLGLSLSLLVGVVLGGRSSLLGAIIGGILLVWLPEFVLSLAERGGWEDQITNNAPNLIYGLLVVLVVLAAPGGIVGSVQQIVAKLTRRAPTGV